MDILAIDSHALHPDLELLVQELPARAVSASTPDVADLAAQLYLWYTNCSPVRVDEDIPGPQDLDLVAALRAAHVATTSFEGGWRAMSVSSRGRVVGERADRQRMFDRIDYVAPGRPGEPAQPGDPIFVTRRVDWVDEPSSFWYTQVGTWPPPAIERIVRIYVNAARQLLPTVVARLTRVLDGQDSADSVMKVQIGEAGGPRADTIVVYLSRDGYRRIERELEEEIGQLAPCLRASRPRCTRPLGPGVAYAEGRADGTSYGEELSSLVAQAFYTTPPTERTDPDQLRRVVCAALRDVDRDPREPYRIGTVRPND